MSWPTTILVRLTVLSASLVAVLGVAVTSTSPAVTASLPRTHPASYLSGGWGGRFAVE